jgi:hypothetical protein
MTAGCATVLSLELLVSGLRVMNAGAATLRCGCTYKSRHGISVGSTSPGLRRGWDPRVAGVGMADGAGVRLASRGGEMGQPLGQTGSPWRLKPEDRRAQVLLVTTLGG